MKKLLLSSALLLVTATAASAASIVQTATHDLAYVNWDQLATINKFDTTLGTLNSITIELVGNLSIDLSFWKAKGSSASITDYVAQTFVNLTTDSGTLVNAIYKNNGSNALTQDLTSYTASSPYTYYSGVEYNISNIYTVTSGDIFNFFQAAGTNTTNLKLSADTTEISGSSSGSIGSVVTGEASVLLRITYDYNAVPEPATLLLFGTGLTCLAGIVRRKRSH